MKSEPTYSPLPNILLIDGSRMVSNDRFKKVERLLARQLGYSLAARECGFPIGDVSVRWPLGESSPIAVRSEPEALTRAIRQFGTTSYVEKRICVLFSRAFAEYVLLLRDAAAGETLCLDQGEFWRLFDSPSNDLVSERSLGGSDHAKAYELATLHLLMDKNWQPTGDNLSIEREHGVAVYDRMCTFGSAPLEELINGGAFTTLLAQIIRQGIQPDGTFVNDSVTIAASSVEAHSPDKNEMKYQAPASTESRALDTEAYRWSALEVSRTSPEIQRLFAHELGHWLAAQIVGIPATEVCLVWSDRPAAGQGDGACTVFLGPAIARLDFDHYLEGRIAVLCAGSLADGCMRNPNARAMGGALIQILTTGTGKDDFEKMRELIILYRALQPSTAANPQRLPEEDPNGQDILEIIVPLLRKLKIWDVIRSPEFVSFVHSVIAAEPQLSRHDELHGCDMIQVNMSTDRIRAHIASHAEFNSILRGLVPSFDVLAVPELKTTCATPDGAMAQSRCHM